MTPSPLRLVLRGVRAVGLLWVAVCILSFSLAIAVVDQVAAIFGIEPGGRTGIFAGLHRVGMASLRTAWGDIKAVWAVAVEAARPMLNDARVAIANARTSTRGALQARGWLR